MEIQKTSKNEFLTSVDKEKAKEILQESLARLGKLKSVDDEKILGSVRYGLQSVSMRISWSAHGNQTLFVIQASGDDAWGIAEKSAIERYVELVTHHDNKGYKVNRIGMRLITLAGILGLFIIVMVFFMKHFLKF